MSTVRHLSLYALRYAAVMGHEHILKYLLSKYKYQLNDEYEVCVYHRVHTTVLQENYWGCRLSRSVQTTIMLMDHGADPNKSTGDVPHPSLLYMAVTRFGSESQMMLVLLIRNGANINLRSFDSNSKPVYHFETSVSQDNIFAAEALLVCGCSCGTFSYRMDENDKDNLRMTQRSMWNLMVEWNVEENRVKPLIQMCRTMILIHLSPAANKIRLLPLPPRIIKYLGIPELDKISPIRTD